MTELDMPLRQLLEGNRAWVARRTAEDSEFFRRQSEHHRPQYLWIGCSDARVPANVVTQTEAGEMFVHRNIANLVVPTDYNLLAVVQFAVEVLEVRDVIVCGHEGCGGVRAAMTETPLPLVEAWLENIRTVMRLHAAELAGIESGEARFQRLVELNVVEQVATLARLPVVRTAWARGANLRLHGMVYDIADGLLRDLGVSRDGPPGAAPEEPPIAGVREAVREAPRVAVRSPRGAR